MDAKEMREFLLNEIEGLGSKEALAGVSGLRVSVDPLSTGEGLSLVVELYNGRRNETARNGKLYDSFAGEGERVPGMVARELAHDAVAEILYFVKDWPLVETPDDAAVARLLLWDVVRAAAESTIRPELEFFEAKIETDKIETTSYSGLDVDEEVTVVKVHAGYTMTGILSAIPIDWRHRFDELRIRHARRVVQKLFAEIRIVIGPDGIEEEAF